MAKSIAPVLSLLRLALLGTTALVLLAPATASARVGVTSATDGSPLGKPPAEAERVLRIGIDVQADEVITTNATDRAHLVFLDGTSVTVGPNAQLKIDKFVYDPNTKQGDLAITASKGVFRLVGGKISKTNAISINTPSGTIGIRGGISIFNVGGGSTRAAFIFGHSMTVTGGGGTQTVTRPGFQVTINNGAPPSLPSILPPGGLSAVINQLETGNSSNTGTGGGADQGAQNSGFSGNNSGQGATPQAIGGFAPNTNTNVLTQPVSSTNPAQDPKVTPTVTTPAAPPAAPKTTQTLNGYAAGLIVGQNGTSSTTRAPFVLLSKPTDLSISTDAATSQTKATIIVRGLNGTILSPTDTLELGGGSTAGANPQPTSFFNSDAVYGMVTTADPSRPSKLKPIIGPSTTVQTDSALLSLGAGGANGVVVVGTPGACTCEFLSFGYWETKVTYSATRTDTVFQAPYVAGTLATSVQLPQTGSASFNGFMTGNVQNGSNLYNATGSWGMNWNFASRLGSVTASFDGANFVGAAAAVPGTGGVSFTQGLISTNTNRVGSGAGSFFASPTNPAMYAAGSFNVTNVGGTPYKAAGVFAGQQQISSGSSR